MSKNFFKNADKNCSNACIGKKLVVKKFNGMITASVKFWNINRENAYGKEES